MEALPLRAGRANCMSNIQQDMIEQTLAILASMMQRLRMTLPSTVPIVDCGFPGFRFRQYSSYCYGAVLSATQQLEPIDRAYSCISQNHGCTLRRHFQQRDRAECCRSVRTAYRPLRIPVCILIQHVLAPATLARRSYALCWCSTAGTTSLSARLLRL